MKTLKIIERIGKAIFAPELLQAQKAYADSIEQYQQTIEEMDLQFDYLMRRCKDAEEALQEKDKEIERLKDELNHIRDATKKVEEPPADEWAGFVPKIWKVGGCSDQYTCDDKCDGYTHRLCDGYTHRFCTRFQNDLPSTMRKYRLPECIEEYGLNPGEVNP